tara:strand:- start:11 stop:400 length:390 start_codon:yes stop_codon:yes gene_type:complete
MAFKMKGSPMQRNFGSALKQKKYEVNTKTGEVREMVPASGKLKYGGYIVTKEGSEKMTKGPKTRHLYVASDKDGNRLVGDVDPKTTESATAEYKPESADTKTTAKNDDPLLRGLPKGAKRVTDEEGNPV